MNNAINSSRSTIIGMLAITLAQFLWNTNDAIIKLVVAKIPLSHILLLEHITGLLFSILWWKFKQPKNTINWFGDKPYIFNIWSRSFFHFFMSVSYFWAITVIPLGDASCIFYYCPLLIIFIAHFYLKEALPNIFILISSLILTISGITFISITPSYLMNILFGNIKVESLNIYGVIAILLSGLSWTASCILIRQAKHSHVLQLEMVNSFQSLFIWTPLLSLINHYTVNNPILGDIFMFHNWAFDIKSMCIMILIGCLGYFGILLMTLGYQLGDATKVSMLEYIVIVFSFGYQILLFGNIPTMYQSIGAILVIIGCLLPVGEEMYNYYHNTHSILSQEETDDEHSDL
eukprot:49587_1